jgi:hypothetical protein
MLEIPFCTPLWVPLSVSLAVMVMGGNVYDMKKSEFQWFVELNTKLRDRKAPGLYAIPHSELSRTITAHVNASTRATVPCIRECDLPHGTRTIKGVWDVSRQRRIRTVAALNLKEVESALEPLGSRHITSARGTLGKWPSPSASGLLTHVRNDCTDSRRSTARNTAYVPAQYRSGLYSSA